MKYISGENGKPYFLGYEKIFFNISHTEKTAVCVFSDTETGCDIEKPREYSDRFVRRFFSENECSRIENSNNKPYEFIRIWTRKESFLKAYGSGITQRLSELDTLEDTKKIGNDVYYFTEYGTIRNAFLTVCSKNRRFCSDITEISI